MQKETPPSPPTEEQEARFERARAHAKLVRRQRERLREELACLDEEIASSAQNDLNPSDQSDDGEEQVVSTQNDLSILKAAAELQAQEDLAGARSYNKFVQSLCDSQDGKSGNDGYASRTPARQARVSKQAAVRFEPYQPSPQPMTPQDQQRLMDFEEYCMICQVRETQALMTPSTPYTVALGPPPGGPPGGPFTKAGHVPKIFTAPRVGGLDDTGPWTGNGMGLTHLSPRTENCRRGFYGDPMKAMRQQTKIDTECQKGMADAKTLYCLKTETAAEKTSAISRKMKENLVVCGLEPVFQLVQRDGKIIDMLKNAMRVKEPMLKTWLDDLLILSVHDGHGEGFLFVNTMKLTCRCLELLSSTLVLKK